MDLVVSFETIEHIEEHEQFMREIVRVLRPHGRLLISSPNKLVYSDEGHFHNPFHARELYFDQFRDLLQHWFADTRIYGQRIIAASAVHPLRGLAADARCIGPMMRADERGLPALPAPAYFIALCFRTPPERGDPLLDSVFVDPRDDLLDDIVHPESQLVQRDGVLQIDTSSGAQRVLKLPPASVREAAPDPDEAESRPAQPAAEAFEREIARLAALVEHLERERGRTAETARADAAAAEQQAAAAAHEASGFEQRAAAAEARALAAERACRSLESRLGEVQAALRDAAASRAADGALVESLRAELARCRAEHAETQAQLTAVLRSASWRVTKPIREALRSFRRS
jgi:SAM-dependent methyltransferase